MTITILTDKKLLGKHSSNSLYLVSRNVYLVEHYPDLVLLLPDGLDGLLELITDVQLVGVKQ